LYAHMNKKKKVQPGYNRDNCTPMFIDHCSH
jgi:hypothetical protein